MGAKPKKAPIHIPLRPRLTCPHCGRSFAPGDILWIAEHPSLIGDDLLGSDEQRRFLPSRFDVEGNAVDVRGVTCHDLACPNCHLAIPRALVELESIFISTLGAPSSGKSYFLAAMIQQTQEFALRYFQSNLADVDPVGNDVVNDYLDKLFRTNCPGELVALEKTQLTGRQYNSVNLDQRDIYLAKPYVYAFQPLEHQSSRVRRKLCRAVCLYDNAGEHFMPGKTAGTMATQHMAHSRVLLFLFDPLQHSRFRPACFGMAADPQLGHLGKNNPQDQVLMEAARRVRNLTGLPQHAKFERPLIVVVTKYDVWRSLLEDEPISTVDLLCHDSDGRWAIDLTALSELSSLTRDLLFKYAPDIVAAAEGFSNEVLYVPNSALGCSPEVIPDTSILGVRPSNISPILAELPLLYALHRAVPTLVRGIYPKLDEFQPTSSDELFDTHPDQPPAPVVEEMTDRVLTPGARIARAMAAQFVDESESAAQPEPKSVPSNGSVVREVPLAEAPSNGQPKVENYLKEAGP